MWVFSSYRLKRISVIFYDNREAEDDADKRVISGITLDYDICM